MHVEHHPLIKDLPELREQLHSLRESDGQFARQADEYEALDKRICRIEEGSERLDDAGLAELKLQRVQLKDELVRKLKKKAGGACCGCCGG